MLQSLPGCLHHTERSGEKHPGGRQLLPDGARPHGGSGT